MTVDLNKMLTTTEDFQTDQLKTFTDFMETSKGIIASLESVEAKAEQDHSQMQEAITTFEQAKKGKENVPCLALKYDEEYKALMNQVVLVANEYQDPRLFCDYIDARSRQITDAMKKGKVSHE
ncbi:hypothetical protein [uncultured Shewanella sp.]|uniref:hypothetical protein n=1 Tax=uncultured Shewanella sp. TaxID=173975 RepID=UPI00263073E5|nr:hypothetical protein [uncultured Shewanella sp.]